MKGKARRGRRHRSNPGPVRSSAPKLGASYQAAKLGVALVGPPAYQIAIGKSPAEQTARNIFSEGDHAYPKGVAVSLLDQWGSKKLGHAAALSRKSLTALAPEALEIVDAAQRTNLDPAGSVREANMAFTGYNMGDRTFSADRVRRYAIAKYGLGIARKVLNKTRIAEPVKAALSMMGVTL